MDLNKVMIIGRLTQDPEVRATPSGQSVASFSLATNRVYTDQSGQKQEKAEFHNIVAWGKLADICGQYLNKGRRVFLEGRLQTRDWVGQDGLRKFRTEVIAENMIMLEKGGSNQATSPDMPSVNKTSNQDIVQEEQQIETIPF